MKKDMSSQDMHPQKNDFVTGDGKIYPWATIKTLPRIWLSKEAGSSPVGEDEGCEWWSEHLEGYNVRRHRAEIKGNAVVIVDRQSQEELCQIPFHCFTFITLTYKRKVLPDGRLGTETGEKEWCDHDPQDFELVKQGLPPLQLDNSMYIKVSPERVGQILHVVHMRPDSNSAIYTNDGERVGADISHPFAYHHWVKGRLKRWYYKWVLGHYFLPDDTL